MITYNGKELTVVTVEHLIRSFQRMDYYPPAGSDAQAIFNDSHRFDTQDIFDALDEYLEHKINWSTQGL